MKSMEEIGLRIRKYRHLRNLTQEYMASEIGIDTSNYSRMEIGRTAITLQRLFAIAETLNVEPEWLILDQSKLHALQSGVEMQHEIALLKEEIRHLRLLITYFENSKGEIVPDESMPLPPKPLLNFKGGVGGIYYGSNKYI
jgi:transcriptional regulator with XRE-family HTH domain